MPELPEVEVLRRSLLRRLPGRRILRVEKRSPSLREPLDLRRLRRLCEGRRIVDLHRRSKYLLIELVDPESRKDSALVIHLGMSGRLTVVPSYDPPAPHEHIAWHLGGHSDDGPDAGDEGTERLRLVDPRRFGLAFALRSDELATDRHFAHLGIEPLSDTFDGSYLRQLARGRRGPVKSFLMDGRLVVGVGNIYACESLWRAGIHPTRSVARIGAARWDRLGSAVRAVLGEAIEQGGTTLNDFADSEGNAGYFQVSLSVYGREGEPCRRCGRLLRRIVQSGRSTFYCPGCQR